MKLDVKTLRHVEREARRMSKVRERFERTSVKNREYPAAHEGRVRAETYRWVASAMKEDAEEQGAKQ